MIKVCSVLYLGRYVVTRPVSDERLSKTNGIRTWIYHNHDNVPDFRFVCGRNTKTRSIAYEFAFYSVLMDRSSVLQKIVTYTAQILP